MKKKVLKVLLIEDNVADAVLIGELLKDFGDGFDLKTSNRLSTALKTLEEESFDIILLDLGLPDSSGIETLGSIQERDPKLPVIVLTGLSDEELAARTISMGAQDYLIKGNFEPELLYRAISYAIERKRFQQELSDSEERFRRAVMDAAFPIMIHAEDGEVIRINRTWTDLTGYTHEEIGTISAWTEKAYGDNKEQVRKHIGTLYGLDGRIDEGEYVVNTRTGEKRVWEFSSVPLGKLADGRRLVMSMAHDVTERKRMAEEIRHMALHDVLTGLPNRRLFLDLMRIGIADSGRYRKKFAVLFLDLDRFKDVNDTLGHEAGDALLREVSGRLSSCLRKSDTISRIGGDEFNVIIADMRAVDDAGNIARKIVKNFRTPFMIDGHKVHITISIGISVFPDDGADINTLLRYADIAMYHAKESGRNRYVFYNPAINARSIERMRFENSLRQAIAGGELELYYQPLFDIRTRNMISAEVLIRWNHPERGLLEPKAFLSAAEDIGVMGDIDEWVMKSAGRQVKEWIGSGLSPVSITINLSGRQLRNPNLVNRISMILDETGMPPECLDIEITESAAMGDIENTVARLKELAGMGVHISIDDFGTGYSSLNYLKRLPIQRLKIDQSFIKDIATNPDDRAIISAVIAMAHEMKLRVLAEGVETEEQLSFLMKVGCDEMQGYLFGRPVPAGDYETILASAKRVFYSGS